MSILHLPEENTENFIEDYIIASSYIMLQALTFFFVTGKDKYIIYRNRHGKWPIKHKSLYVIILQFPSIV